MVDKGGTSSKVDDLSRHLHGSDHPSIPLITTVLDGRNYWLWSIGIRTAQEAKDKIGFVDGSIKPPEDQVEYRKWKKVDYMVKSWLINSISEEISELFIFCLASKALWDVLEERYGVNKRASDVSLAKVNVTYSSMGEGSSALMAKAFQGKNEAETSKKRDISKKDKYCDHCKAKGHTRDVYIKMYGYLEWFKEFKEKKAMAQKKQMENLTSEGRTDTPISQDNDASTKVDLTNMVSYLMKEVQRLSKAKAKDEQRNQLHPTKGVLNVQREYETADEEEQIDVPDWVKVVLHFRSRYESANEYGDEI
ncbi:Reverse transcriptase, RNA-dependent DNA polymerase [Senna tora]|uniref:Reverse transcriptase, RNA-dependent DNA polymerase n=1 Tax=Senna tora TaxID=362788 RepID=A0A834WPD9_9FABA|nr:Reverse transcriptase, RNA-dependent DNA polymerase [Senna tora]